MVSENTMKPVIWVFKLCLTIGAVPGYWDSSKCCVGLKPGRKIHLPYFPSIVLQSEKMVPSIYTALQLINIIYLFVFFIFLEHSTTEKLVSVSLLLAFVFAIANQVILVLYFEEYACSINSFLLLDLKLRKYSILMHIHSVSLKSGENDI